MITKVVQNNKRMPETQLVSLTDMHRRTEREAVRQVDSQSESQELALVV